MEAKESLLRSTIEAEMKAKATSTSLYITQLGQNYHPNPVPEVKSNGLVYDNRLIYSTLEVGSAHTRNLSSDYQVPQSKIVQSNASMFGP